ncbi:MAG: hypothetical protein EZS28_018688 [Streblomastix strix]|uniref:Uncharacterized protein n=1 Tax=Streblomastix strix TaxID=222440 RepID=A0A5J4VUH0_9EUKA|nr:MAG: hypothetical protein EZS28_018688 [Streblomastix strix]
MGEVVGYYIYPPQLPKVGLLVTRAVLSVCVVCGLTLLSMYQIVSQSHHRLLIPRGCHYVTSISQLTNC